MRKLTFLLLLSAVWFGCGGCEDEATSNNTNPGTNQTSAACEDADGDGASAGDDCPADTLLDCDDSDAQIGPAIAEACGDGVDNNCDGDIDENCADAPCREGETRSCGENVGRCTEGTSTCVDGRWSECDGEGPVSETCNGVDDDCDGEIDENGIELCDDGLICNGVSVCEEGACTEPELLDCTHLDGPCATGMCSEKDRGCRVFPNENGSTCDDGLFCTEGGVCQAGECVGTPRDCSGEEDACNIGVCDEDADSCVKQPKSDGIVCDDGSYCTVGDTCSAGVCGGNMRDCSNAADQCNSGVCDEATDSCVPAPIADGTACEDGQYCTTGDTCVAGACTGGAPRQCGATGGSCRDGVCDEATDSCTGNPVADGTPCDDGQYCTTADSCTAGVCQGGGPRDCSAQDGTCRVGTCSESINSCIPAPAPDGSSCDDGLFCTTNDSCNAGACSGSSRNCASAGGECTTGTCDESADACVPVPVSDGTACPDAEFCTQNEVCLAGACDRAPRDCSGEGDVCNEGVCDESADSCVAVPKVDGTTCTDGLFCTTNDSCQAGVCTGGPTSCSQFDDVCTVGTCDEDMNSCVAMAMPDNEPCDDGQFCTVTDSCSGGVCVGAQRNCAGESDNCNLGVCDDTADACVKQPVADGTDCNDGDFCTVPDTCTAGVCGGDPRDCSVVADDCNAGLCTQSGCVPVPLADGTSCPSDDFCVVNTQCMAGSCQGEPRVCADDPPCRDGFCDSTAGACTLVDNGTCDICSTSTPTADAGPDQSAIPDQVVSLNGTGSSDPMGQTLTYSWRIADAPQGSTSTLSSTTSATPTLLADVSGTYLICLTVTDSPDACVSDEDCMEIDVVPLVDLHIELVWFNDDSDMDLHYQAPAYSQARWFTTTGVTWYGTPTPDWGGGANGDQPDGDNTNDPRLDVDNRDGFGPENINQSNLFDGSPFTIAVHYFTNTDTTLEPFTGATDARIRVFEGSNPNPIFERTRNLKCEDFWEVGEVTVSNNGTQINVTPKNSVTKRSPSTQPTCRCNSDSDCHSGETCKPFRLQGGGPPRFVDFCAP